MPPEKIAVMAQSNRTSTGSTSKYSAIPPDTPLSIRSVRLRYRRLLVERAMALLPVRRSVPGSHRAIAPLCSVLHLLDEDRPGFVALVLLVPRAATIAQVSASNPARSHLLGHTSRLAPRCSGGCPDLA